MSMALSKKWPLYLSSKNTILKKYDGRSVTFAYNSYTSGVIVHFLLTCYDVCQLDFHAQEIHIDGLLQI